MRFVIVDGAGGLHAQEVGQVEADQASRSGLQEAASRGSAAGGNLDLSDVQHGNPPFTGRAFPISVADLVGDFDELTVILDCIGARRLVSGLNSARGTPARTCNPCGNSTWLS